MTGHRAVVDGELVEAELDVPLDGGPAGSVLLGLEVDHDDPALGIELEAVGVAEEPDLLPALEGDDRLEALLGGEQLALVEVVPLQEPGERGLDAIVLAVGRPGGAEVQAAPDLVEALCATAPAISARRRSADGAQLTAHE